MEAWSEADGGALLYGGFAATQFRDLWRWDGSRWSRLTDEGPTFTEGHVVAEAPHARDDCRGGKSPHGASLSSPLTARAALTRMAGG